MGHSKTLRRLGTLALAAVVGAAAMGAGRYAGVPDLAGSLAVAGSLLANPAAAIGAADRIFRQEALPVAQTQVEDAESPPEYIAPPPGGSRARPPPRERRPANRGPRCLPSRKGGASVIGHLPHCRRTAGQQGR